MSFDSPIFFVFFLVVFGVLRLFPKWAGPILLLASIVFYSMAGPLDLGLVVCVVILNYALSFLVAKNGKWLWGVVIANISILAFFKYRHFFFPELAVQFQDFYQTEILIPLGISFYIFQAIAYQADLATGRTTLIRSPWHFALFILLFAQVIAGPIIRANILEPQVSRAYSGRLQGRRIWSIGLGLCVLGLLKKVGLADSIAPYVDNVFSLGPANILTAWIGAVLFGFQIYFDFSGYSDIAVGAGYLLGFKLPMNFRQPYLAIGPQEFWKRWHITLSTWIRDYIYIPLGGSKGDSSFKLFLILLVTMGLAGLWHGSNWTFIVWGILWAFYIFIWRLINVENKSANYFHWYAHILIVSLLWVFFRAANLEEALKYISVMLGFNAYGNYSIYSSMIGAALNIIIVITLYVTHYGEYKLTSFSNFIKLKKLDGPLLWGLLTGLVFWMAIYPKPNNNPFIYFRF